MGFGEGPYPVPRQLYLLGSVPGTAVIETAPLAQASRIKVVASGRISPIGVTSVTGLLRTVGGTERGTLVLNSSQASVTLRLSGPAPAPAPQVSSPSTTSTTLEFTLSGRGVPPSPLLSYQREQGSGTVALTLAPGSGRTRLTLVFRPGQVGGT